VKPPRQVKINNEHRSKTSLGASTKDQKDEAGAMTKKNAISSSTPPKVNVSATIMSTAEKEQLQALHLASLPLVLVVLVCSGFLWMLAFCDAMATAQPISNYRGRAKSEGSFHFFKFV
jgi:hypothetical protein